MFLCNYVKTEGINFYPVFVVLENDGEISLIEGTHRWMCAYLLDMKKIPCIVKVRKNSYEPNFDRNIQQIKELRFVSSS